MPLPLGFIFWPLRPQLSLGGRYSLIVSYVCVGRKNTAESARPPYESCCAVLVAQAEPSVKNHSEYCQTSFIATPFVVVHKSILLLPGEVMADEPFPPEY